MVIKRITHTYTAFDHDQEKKKREKKIAFKMHTDRLNNKKK